MSHSNRLVIDKLCRHGNAGSKPNLVAHLLTKDMEPKHSLLESQWCNKTSVQIIWSQLGLKRLLSHLLTKDM